MERAGRIAIGAVSKHTGTNIETVRYYERVGLLPAAARSSGGYRLYGADHLKRLSFIRRARTLGFSLAEVRKLLALADQRRRPCAEVLVVAAAHLKDVRSKIADLRRMERVLKETVARCKADGGSHCAVIEALYTDIFPAGRSATLRRPRPLAALRRR
jgi:MerR family mercuric resistance operon transcriptional regulator